MLLLFFSVLHEVMRKQAVLYLKFRPWQSSWRPLLIPEASFNLPRKKSFNYWIDDKYADQSETFEANLSL